MKKEIENFENYFIYDDGSVFNSSTQKMLNGSISQHGYKYYRLSKNNKKTAVYAHRLVAEAFIDNPDNLPIVNHKDGNKLNNNISNLEWVSYSDNTNHFHHVLKKTNKHSSQQKYTEDLEGEIWVPAINNENYKVSSKGRVRNIKTNTLLRSSLTCGYDKVRLSKNGETTDWLVHKLVYQSFNNLTTFDNKKYCIDHIDGNKKNNNLENLRQITYSENVQEAFYNQKLNSNIKPVSQFSITGDFIATFPSSREAARQLKLDGSSITKCCKGKLKTTGGYIFHYA